MKHLIKITATALACVMLLGLLASAADIDTRAFGSFLASDKYMRFAAPVVYASGNIAAITAELPAADTEETEIIDRGHFAYVVTANQRLNMDSGLYYANLTLINETGLFNVTTVDDVENYNFRSVLTTERVGKITELEGKFIQFDMKKTDKIQRLEPRWSTVQTSFSTEDGFYLVNVIGERNGVLSFYDTSANIEDVQSAEPYSCRYHEDGHAVICIDEDKYYGSVLAKISSRETSLPAGIGNAVIQISEGKIMRVFSFENGYKI